MKQNQAGVTGILFMNWLPNSYLARDAKLPKQYHEVTIIAIHG